MIPSAEISGSLFDAIFVYVAVLGILILCSTWLRVQIPVLKKYHIPASLIAGIIGLILGPHFLRVIPQEMINCWSALSGRLIVLVFAPMMMGRRAKQKGLVKRTAAEVICCYGYTFVQYAIPLLLGALLLTPLFGVNPLFGTIVEQGWAGGHGTAGGMALVFEELGWADGASLSITSATVGLVFGIVGGIALINIGVKRGWTTQLKDAASLKIDADELYADKEKRPVSGYSTVASGVVNNYAFHLSLISVAVFIGWILNKLLKMYLNFSVSWFVTALFGGLLLQLVLNRTKWGDAVDSGTMSNIQGLALEFLVAGAVASVNVTVIVAYAVPLLIQQVIMMVIMTLGIVWYARHVIGEYWFENAMCLFGTYTGVAATGLLLLKTCDPEMKTDAAELFASRSPFCSWALGGGVLTSLTPVWVSTYGAMKVGIVYLLGVILCLVLPKILKCWYPFENQSEKSWAGTAALDPSR